MDYEELKPWRFSRSGRRRNESIMVTPEGILELRGTPRSTEKHLLEFAYAKRDWIRRQRAKISQTRRHDDMPENTIIFRGEYHPIVFDPDMLPGCIFADGKCYVGGQPEKMLIYISRHLLLQTKKVFTERVDHYRQIIPKASKFLKKLNITGTKTRWGSCSTSGTLSLCRRLILAPPRILDYIIIHELCHFSEMNHSARFWKLVEQYDPDYEAHRQWLAENQTRLKIAALPDF